MNWWDRFGEIFRFILVGLLMYVLGPLILILSLIEHMWTNAIIGALLCIFSAFFTRSLFKQ